MPLHGGGRRRFRGGSPETCWQTISAVTDDEDLFVCHTARDPEAIAVADVALALAGDEVAGSHPPVGTSHHARRDYRRGDRRRHHRPQCHQALTSGVTRSRQLSILERVRHVMTDPTGWTEIVSIEALAPERERASRVYGW